jgi:cytochrome c556
LSEGSCIASKINPVKSMRLRIALALLGLTVTAVAVLAQSDPVKEREDLMKQNDKGAKLVVGMMRGQAPFDGKAVDAAFAQWTDTAHKLPSLFPDNSKTGGDNRASPKIWENKKDFEAKAAEFAKTVADNRAKAVASVDGLKAAIPLVGDACDNCHKDYRLSKR